MENKTEGLTPLQEQKYYALLPTYGHEQAKAIAANLTNKGKHSYAPFIDKYGIVSRAKNDDLIYFDEIYNTFEIGKAVTPGEIITGISDARLNLELDPHTTKLKSRCETDFFLLFVVKEIIAETLDINGKTKKVVTAYIPMAKVKPEEV